MAAKKENKATKKQEVFLNPFNKGVSFKQFLDAQKKSGKSIEDYSKGKLSDEQIKWIVKELKILNK